MILSQSFIKIIAIISVIIAHVNNNPTGHGFDLLRDMSILGVPLFLASLGFWWELNPKGLRSRINLSLFTSWIIWATVIYFLTCLFGSTVEVTPVKWGLYVFGYRSIYYYVPVYILLVIVLSNVTTVVAPIIFLLSLSLTSTFEFFKIFNLNYHLFGYLNPLIWLVYPALGALLAKWGRFTGLALKFQIAFSGFGSIITALTINQDSVAYFSTFSTLFACFGVIFIFSLSVHMPKGRNMLEKNTWWIYLTHLPLAGFVSILDIGPYPVSVTFRVVLILSIYLATFSVIPFLGKVLPENIKCNLFKTIGIYF